jgi:hypothetical protein
MVFFLVSQWWHGNSERETILTLKDVDILDEKYEDVLVNVNIMDTERTKGGSNSHFLTVDFPFSFASGNETDCMLVPVLWIRNDLVFGSRSSLALISDSDARINIYLSLQKSLSAADD